MLRGLAMNSPKMMSPGIPSEAFTRSAAGMEH
jgi:hypothetical protein